MPQLDIVSFFSQYFWTTFVFFITFFILSKYFLPTIARTLLFREKIYKIEQTPVLKSENLFSSKNTVSEHNTILWEHGEKFLDGIASFEKKKDSFKNKGLHLLQNQKESILKNITDSTQIYWSFSEKNKRGILLNTIFLYK